MDSRSYKILVTGGAGFIGSHTVVALHEAGFVPVIVDNFSNSQPSVLEGLEKITGHAFPFYQIDCNDRDAMAEVFAKEKLHGVIHFAAYKAVGESVREPLKYYHNNLNSLIVLLELMAERGVQNLVFSSSCTVYGQAEKLPVTEETPILPAESPYGNTKQISEEIIRDSVKAGMPIRGIALRYFNPIGAHPSGLIGELPLGVPNNLVPFIAQTAAGIRPELSVFGGDYETPDGTCIRDYIHVMDLAEAHVKSLQWLDQQSGKSLYDVFNVGTGRGNSVLEVIKTFEEQSGMPVNYKIVDRRPGDVIQIYGGVSKARRTLGWEARRGLAESMRDAWHWQQQLGKEA
ncbi:UDP-glucose 4-epimerase [Catalinimonas alkaloidigena]|uniref:UDP-glucose 4-epimerase n=1 Tax=Catalinimonas alkaloidigena TaxID=1075417 RepID=A0A1G9DSP7_9BACT|nr:UDP-glucose 4-epimerase GalE [Catalinimonas alkaloidigena]SDK66899.1 UDP-glucose 4-epimerase [Catalinimonas alkaloidigena]